MSANNEFLSDTSESKLSVNSDAELSDSFARILDDVGAGKKKIGGKKKKTAAK
jgi:hypothetical protein